MISRWFFAGGGHFLSFPKAWNPYRTPTPPITLASSNLEMQKPTSGNGTGISTPMCSISTGMSKYAEIKINSFTNGVAVGVAQGAIDITQDLGFDSLGWAYRTFLGSPDLYHNSASAPVVGSGTGFSNGDVIGLWFNYTGATCSLSIFRNGTLEGSGPQFTGLTGTLYVAVGTVLSNIFDITANFVGPITSGSLPAGASFF